MSRCRLFPDCQFWTWGPKRLGLPQPFTVLKGALDGDPTLKKKKKKNKQLFEESSRDYSQSPFHFASLARVQGETDYYFLNTDLPLRPE